MFKIIPKGIFFNIIKVFIKKISLFFIRKHFKNIIIFLMQSENTVEGHAAELPQQINWNAVQSKVMFKVLLKSNCAL